MPGDGVAPIGNDDQSPPRHHTQGETSARAGHAQRRVPCAAPCTVSRAMLRAAPCVALHAAPCVRSAAHSAVHSVVRGAVRGAVRSDIRTAVCGAVSGACQGR
eukprot:11414389-Alexandrium_andersonii.AAC.1